MKPSERHDDAGRASMARLVRWLTPISLAAALGISVLVIVSMGDEGRTTATVLSLGALVVAAGLLAAWLGGARDISRVALLGTATAMASLAFTVAAESTPLMRVVAGTLACAAFVYCLLINVSLLRGGRSG